MDRTVFVAIIVRDPLVSQDIAGIFSFWHPGTVSRVFETVAQARAMPSDEFDAMLVFVAAEGGTLALERSDFDWLQRRGVIALDLKDQVHFPHWQHLARPFTQEQVIEAAHRLTEEDRRERVEAE